MGLDMYAYARRPEYTSGAAPCRKPLPVDDADVPDEGKWERLFYWRKHANLHGWMSQLWESKYPVEAAASEGFNCAAVELSLKDLNLLERAVLDQSLPHTAGFFFGASAPENRYEDLRFIALAREAIADGWVVFYDSWW